ncbi:hypothetical protein PRIPAC_83515, partial [Pristionchus pacificus]|uniref:Uncharacterized protein n=1 Tax=Pristionchus pacificus TaxID=54126 RepID=A0A2A6BLQ0_PRIPA
SPHLILQLQRRSEATQQLEQQVVPVPRGNVHRRLAVLQRGRSLKRGGIKALFGKFFAQTHLVSRGQLCRRADQHLCAVQLSETCGHVQRSLTRLCLQTRTESTCPLTDFAHEEVRHGLRVARSRGPHQRRVPATVPSTDLCALRSDLTELAMVGWILARSNSLANPLTLPSSQAMSTDEQRRLL